MKQSNTNVNFENSIAFAQEMDAHDPLKKFRDRFYFPKQNDKDAIYFCGNSLGLQPKKVRELVEQELKDWETLGVEGHLKGKNPWYYYHHFTQEKLARLVGAQKEEVIAMNSLTVNLQLMLVSFFRPHGKRCKILLERGAFPSDQYAVQSQLKLHGLDPQKDFLELEPRVGELNLRTEDILSYIKNHGEEIALVMFGGVNYYTGQFFDLEKITTAAHESGAMCGFDLAHAVGNVPLKLHQWNVDFAVWCSYKYLNSGPGGVGGAFVHKHHGNNPEIPRLSGWWGHDEENRFKMEKDYHVMKGAAGWQLSNAPVLPMAIHAASLEIFEEAGIEILREKSLLLTGYLEFLLKETIKTALPELKILTPENPQERGCQISILTGENGKHLHEKLTQHGVMADWRNPNVIRVAPVPLYNCFEDVYRFVEILKS